MPEPPTDRVPHGLKARRGLRCVHALGLALGVAALAIGLLTVWSLRWRLREAQIVALIAAAECPAAEAAPLPAAQAPRAAAAPARDPCVRPAPGSEVVEPRDLRASHGVLRLNLTIHNFREADGSVRYCYLMDDGTESPTLRLHPGDLLILRLKDDLVNIPPRGTAAPTMPMAQTPAAPTSPALPERQPVMASLQLTGAHAPRDPCSGALMSPVAANLHFHGLTVPARCHEDDVLMTSILPGEPPFEYRFRIPLNEPPGLYWYHPHIHGYDGPAVLGGASGALIIEGIERAVPMLAALPERVFVIRDLDLLHPNAPPSKSEPVVPKMLIDRDGDAANNGTGFGTPAKDLSINFVPVPYPDYPRATLHIRPGEKQLWRVVNSSTVTYLNLALLYGKRFVPQQLGIVAIDGVPLQYGGSPAPAVEWVNHIGLPPGARMEFIVTGPPEGVPGLLVTRTVDTGQGGENDPNRALATVIASDKAPEPTARLPREAPPLPHSQLPWLGNVQPVRVRHLYFSEKLLNPKDPNSATVFYITIDGQTPRPFDPRNGPDIIATQGTVEDWIIENRSNELHAFHIHQLHFQLVDWMGLAVNEPFLRDTVNVPYYNGRTLTYPSVRLRMDFRDPNTIGTFVYHCHLMEHADNGMMGMIRVDPPARVTR
ncbi:MAG TPA: multicopper oxidase domain-containing protein [Steroidobacteraceae bacterium]|nr:multicopper oxidase domain-containing protein [Steroidobacteraceae bacterium]